MIMRIWFSQHNLNSFALSRLNTVAMPHLMREACVQRARSPSSLSTRAHTSRKEDDTRERDKAEAQKPEKKDDAFNPSSFYSQFDRSSCARAWPNKLTHPTFLFPSLSFPLLSLFPSCPFLKHHGTNHRAQYALSARGWNDPHHLHLHQRVSQTGTPVQSPFLSAHPSFLPLSLSLDTSSPWGRTDQLRKPITAFAIHEKSLIVACADRTVSLFSLPEAEFERVITLPPLDTRSLSLSPDGAYLAVATDGLFVSILDVSTGKEICRTDLHGGPVRCVAFDASGSMLATVDIQGRLKIWSWTGIHTRLIHSVSLNRPLPDGEDNFSHLISWDPKTGNLATADANGEFSASIRGAMTSMILCPCPPPPSSSSHPSPFPSPPLQSGVLILERKNKWYSRRLGLVDGQIHGLSYSVDGQYLALYRHSTVQILKWEKSGWAQAMDKVVDHAATGISWAPDNYELAISDNQGQLTMIPTYLPPPITLTDLQEEEEEEGEEERWDGMGKRIKNTTSKAKHLFMDDEASVSEEDKGEDEEEDEEDGSDSMIDDDMEDEEEEDKGAQSDDMASLFGDPVPARRKRGMQSGARSSSSSSKAKSRKGHPKSLSRTSSSSTRSISPLTFLQPGSVNLSIRPVGSSGSTRLFDYNTLGSVMSMYDGATEQAVIRVDFHDQSTYRGFNFVDPHHFDLGCLGKEGLLLASTVGRGKAGPNPTLHFRYHAAWSHNSDWTIHLDPDDQVKGISLTQGHCFVYTANGLLRIYTTSGIAQRVIALPHVFSMRGQINGERVFLLLREGSTGDLRYGIYGPSFPSSSTWSLTLGGHLPWKQDQVTWCGWSEEGVVGVWDGQVEEMLLWSGGPQPWYPLKRASDPSKEEGEKGRGSGVNKERKRHAWVIGMTEGKIHFLPCREGDPLVPGGRLMDVRTEELLAPITSMNTLSGRDMEARLIRLNALVDSSVKGTEKDLVDLDKITLSLIHAACKADKALRAYDLACTLESERSLMAAVKIASYNHMSTLAGKVNELIEARLAKEAEEEEEEEERGRGEGTWDEPTYESPLRLPAPTSSPPRPLAHQVHAYTRSQEASRASESPRVRKLDVMTGGEEVEGGGMKRPIPDLGYKPITNPFAKMARDKESTGVTGGDLGGLGKLRAHGGASSSSVPSPPSPSCREDQENAEDTLGVKGSLEEGKKRRKTETQGLLDRFAYRGRASSPKKGKERLNYHDEDKDDPSGPNSPRSSHQHTVVETRMDDSGDETE
ncbi:MAG: hypothetical protein DHS80DRAFT_23243 [Piptocephalis tieghemiana]|nr:MAG: hypothetical protein DHS80DRAFT_23243 [Piptocephalis tieghemiana]